MKLIESVKISPITTLAIHKKQGLQVLNTYMKQQTQANVAKTSTIFFGDDCDLMNDLNDMTLNSMRTCISSLNMSNFGL